MVTSFCFNFPSMASLLFQGLADFLATTVRYIPGAEIHLSSLYNFCIVTIRFLYSDENRSRPGVFFILIL